MPTRTLRIDALTDQARPITQRPVKRRQVKGEAFFSRPVRCSLPEGRFLCMPAAIPLPNGSVDRVECPEAFAYVKDDEGMAAEITRVLAPGGTVWIRVPATGLLAGMDAFNLQRYLVDTSRRGERPPETTELGWRRHYGQSELLAMFGHGGFTIESVNRRGLALGELLTFSAMLLFRWLIPNGKHYRALARRIDPLDRLDRQIVSPVGFWLEIVARKPTRE